MDWQALSRAVIGGSVSAALRFRGAFTDGGCDEGRMQYWADNMFAPNHYEAYCSAVAGNVHVIGLLLVRSYA